MAALHHTKSPCSTTYSIARLSPVTDRKLTRRGGNLERRRLEPLQVVLVHLGEVQVHAKHLVLLEERPQLGRTQNVSDVLPDLVWNMR